jgi:hypothetical protein
VAVLLLRLILLGRDGGTGSAELRAAGFGWASLWGPLWDGCPVANSKVEISWEWSWASTGLSS